jgi:undecaprenyl diphosphate synthase
MNAHLTDFIATTSVSPPRHVAIIMDGNGRWAEARRLMRGDGHRQGASAVRRVVRAARRRGIGFLTLYAFSMQNWGRPTAEVSGLMRLLADFLREERQELMRTGIRLVAIGRIGGLPPEVRDALTELIRATADNTAMTLCLALSYGAREALVDAVRTIVDAVQGGELAADGIAEHTVSAALDGGMLPPVDLLIRTAGEQRLSNFLLWESAYAELRFVRKRWPDFGAADLAAALRWFARRQRRFGCLTAR